MDEDEDLMEKLGVTVYECYEDRTGLKLTLLTTIKKQRPAAIAKAIENYAATKPNASDRILIREVGLSPLIMTFTRSNETNREDNFIYLGMQKAIETGDRSYHKWVNPKPKESNKIKRIHKELEIDMVHKPLEPRKKARTEDPVVEEAHDQEEEELVVEESSVPFNAIEEEVEPISAPAPEANASEAADILASMAVGPPPPSIVPRIDEGEVAVIKELNAELKGELRGMTEAVAGYKESVKSKADTIKILSKSKASEIRTLKQMLKDYKARADHFERLSFQLRGQLGSSQREVNRPVRQENDRLAHDVEWLQERVEVNEKRILPTLKSISRRVR